MTPNESHGFRLTVLNPSGRDPEQDFADYAGEPGRHHAPVNFHAFAACTRGSFQREIKRALAQKTPVLLLLRSDFKASQRALAALKAKGRTVVVSLKETGLHQIAQHLREPSKLARFIQILRVADGSLATTPEAADIFSAIRGGNSSETRFMATPYPIDDSRWDFSRPVSERAGILVGTREWNVPSRNHLAALLLARQLNEATGEEVTVFDYDGRAGVRRLGVLNFRAQALRVIDRHFSYPDYLREVSRHKIILQLDTSFVPGQVAGDALLCRTICVGGNGAIDRLVFADTCGAARSIAEIGEMARHLLQDRVLYERAVAASQERAVAEISYAAAANRLANFFANLSFAGA